MESRERPTGRTNWKKDIIIYLYIIDTILHSSPGPQPPHEIDPAKPTEKPPSSFVSKRRATWSPKGRTEILEVRSGHTPLVVPHAAPPQDPWDGHSAQWHYQPGCPGRFATLRDAKTLREGERSANFCFKVYIHENGCLQVDLGPDG